jgi:hypothetical protein
MTDDEILRRLKETCILLYSTDGLPGTGYIVAHGFAATANHVVRSWTDDVWYPIVVGWPALRSGIEAKVIRRNEPADVAVLALKGCDGIRPIPVGDLPTAKTAWAAFGFPSAAAVDGIAVGLPMGGTVHDANWVTPCQESHLVPSFQ